MRAAVLLLALALAVPLVPPARAATQVVHIRNLAYDPVNLTVAPGDSVQWVNDDAVTHTATDKGGAWDTGNIGPGQSRTLLFDHAASYAYICTIHGSIMTGQLQVRAPDVAPSVAISAPDEGATLAGNASVQGTASDADGSVVRAEVRVDGGAWRNATGTTSWSLALDTTLLDDGAHLLEARSTDDRGASSPVAQRNATVANPPSVAFTGPAAEATVRGTVNVTGTASDPGPHGSVAQVEVAVDDGAWQQAQGAASWSFSWATRGVANGTHTLHARATDAGGLVSPVADRSVTVDNPPPTVRITSPAEGDLLHGAVTVQGTADEAGPDGGIVGVEVRVDDGPWQAAAGTTTWTFAWDTTGVADGAHAVHARSSDGHVHSAEVGVGVQVRNHWADLVLVELRSSAGPTSATLTATVANEGNADAPGFDVTFRYLSGGQLRDIGTAHVAALPQGAEQDAQVAWDTLLKVGNFTIEAEADAAHAVPELDRSDDGLLGSACLPDALGLTCVLPPLEVRA